jgi:integrase
MRGLGRVFKPEARRPFDPEHEHVKSCRPEKGCYLKTDVWWLDYSIHGKRHRESSGTTSKRDAQRLLRQRIGDRETGKLTGRPDKVTLADLKGGLERHYTRENLRSWASAKYAFAHLERLLSLNTPASELTTQRVNWYQDSRLAEGAARATVRYEVATLNSAFTVAVLYDQVLVVRPAFQMLTVRNARSGFFEPGDVAALMAELPTPLHRSIVQFAYNTGWRRGEILGLTWDQINWESKVLRIEPPTEEKRSKGEDARVIPFAKTPLEGLLKERWQERDGLFVFHRNGERLFSFYKVWRAACKRAGLAGRRLHDFRRTAVRELINAGVPEKVAMQIVGWKDPQMLRRYHIVVEGDIAQAMAKRYGKHAANQRRSHQKATM